MLAPLDRDITDHDVSIAVLPLNREFFHMFFRIHLDDLIRFCIQISTV